MNEIQIALCLKASEGTGEVWKVLLFAVIRSSHLEQHLSSSSNFMLLLCLLSNMISLYCSQDAGYKSHQTFESLSPFSLWLFLVWGMKYMSVIYPPGADPRSALVCRNESWVGRQEVVKSTFGSQGRLKQATSLFCFIFLPKEVKG